MRIPRSLISLAAIAGLAGCMATAGLAQSSFKWPSPGGPQAQPSAAPSQAMQLAQQHLLKGMEYRKKGKLNEAIAEFKAVIKIAPQSPAGYFYLGTTYLAKGDVKSAEPHLKRVAQLDPANIDVRMQLLQMYMQTNRLSDAVSMGQQAVKLKPKEPRIHFMLGVAYLMKKDTAGALREFRTTAQLDPKNVGAFFNQAIIYGQAGDYAKARQALARAAAVAPKDDRILGMQASIEEKADKVNGPKKALAIYKKALARNPGNPQLQFAVANMYERTGQPKLALEYYRKLMAKNPWLAPARLNAARILLMDRTSKNSKEGYKKAAEYLRPIVQKAPNYPQAAGMLGLAELYLGDNQKAEIHYKQAQKIDPDNPVILEGLAYLYQVGGKPKEALQIVEKLYAARDSDVKTGLRLAGLYDQAGEKQKALGLFQQLVEKYPKDTEAMAARASYLQQQKITDKAAEQYRAILKLKPDDLDTQMKIAYLYAGAEDKAEREKSIPELEAAKKMALKMKPPQEPKDPKAPKDPDRRIDPFRTLASVYEKDNQLAKAADQYKQYLEKDPKSTDAGRGLAQIYEKDTATLDQAIEEYRKLIDMNPDSREFYGMVAAAVKKKTGKEEDELAEYRKLIDAKPQNPTSRYVLAQTLLARQDGDMDEAAKQYQEILKTKPDDEEASIGLARVYEKQKKVDEAIEQYKKALDKKPSQSYALRMLQKLVTDKNDTKTTSDWLAYLKSLLGKKDVGMSGLYTIMLDEYAKASRAPEAIAAVEEQMKKDPKDPQATLALGAYYEKSGQTDKALATYKKVLAITGIPENPKASAYKGIGNIYFSQRKYADALAAYKNWKSRQMFFFGVDQTQVRMAQCLEYLGKTEEAVAEFQSLSNGDPSNQEVQAALRRLKPQPAPPPDIPRFPGPENAPGPPPAGPVAQPSMPSLGP
ncbi:MAG: tetratricopeptide repeat protein [Armatimonadota bacterium]|nr:tetratricopeptide repeat protein [Armatimonadota bacterium]